MFKIRFLKTTQTDLLNVKKMYTLRIPGKKNLHQNCVNFFEIDIMTNCRNL